MMSFNLEGFRRNCQYLSHLLSTSKPSIVFLQEIWLSCSAINTINNLHPDYSFKIATPDMFHHPEDLLSSSDHNWHGAAIGWNNSISASIQPVESTWDRFVGVKMSLSQGSLLLLSLYAPTAGRDDEFLETISNLTVYVNENSNSGAKIIIGADSNCSAKSSQRRQQAWADFCELHELSCYAPPDPSFHHNNGTSDSYIDMFVASSGLEVGQISQLCTLENSLNLSSHDPIETSINVPMVESKRECFENTYTNFNRKKVVWNEYKLQEYQYLAGQALSRSLTYWNTPECLPLLSSLLSKLLVTCAGMVFDVKTPIHRRSPKLSSKAVRQAQKSLEKCFRNWKKDGRPTSEKVPQKSCTATHVHCFRELLGRRKTFSTQGNKTTSCRWTRSSEARYFPLSGRSVVNHQQG